jgi:ATP-binding cassette subfamily A (ABC1) protein 3
LIKILAGISKSTQGTLKFGNDDLNLLYKIQSRRINVGICPPHDILFADLTVRQHLKMICYVKEVAEIGRIIEEVLKKMDLLLFTDHKIGNLSGGCKRRLTLAIAIIGNPNFLLLDEPTSSVDPVSRSDFWDILVDMKRKNRNMVIVLATHHME